MPFIPPKNEEKPKYLQKKFSLIAGKYDLFNDLTTQGAHRYWKRFLVKKAGLKDGDYALDICCGTGDITQRLNNVTGQNGISIGLDFSDGMLAAAKSRQEVFSKNLIRGDAINLPIKSGSLDAVTVGFGLRNLTDIEKCLKEIKRTLKKGGKFLSLDMGKVRAPLIKQLFNFYFFHIVPKIGRLISSEKDIFHYFPHSTIHYPSPEKLSEALKNVGFAKIKFRNFHFGATVIHYAENSE